MTEPRHTASSITDAELDALYDERDRARRLAVALEQENAEQAAALDRVRTECDELGRERQRIENESFGDGYADAAARIQLAIDAPPTA